jgi:exodeoxyribonuclease III
VIVGGDFNIAPDDRDVHDPARLVGATHVSAARARPAGCARVVGLVDVFREHHADDRVYSWWDYRAGDFHQGRGMRIDLLMCSTVGRRANAEWCVIDRNARKGKQPSDHAPVIVDLAD